MNFEFAKWLAFVLMLVDHVFAYVLHRPSAVADFCGSLVLPLFALSFASGVARGRARPFDVFVRLLMWAAIAQACAVLARPLMPLNVLWSFASGYGLFLLASDASEFARWERAVLIAFPLLFGFVTEFGHIGVAVVFFALMWMRDPRDWCAVGGLFSVGLLQPFNESWGAWVAVPLFFGLAVVPWRVPRVRGVFYPAYAAQFVVLGAIAYLRGLA